MLKPKVVAKVDGKNEGYAFCSHCICEADIWLDV